MTTITIKYPSRHVYWWKKASRDDLLADPRLTTQLSMKDMHVLLELLDEVFSSIVHKAYGDFYGDMLHLARRRGVTLTEDQIFDIAAHCTVKSENMKGYISYYPGTDEIMADEDLTETVTLPEGMTGEEYMRKNVWPTHEYAWISSSN